MGRSPDSDNAIRMRPMMDVAPRRTDGKASVNGISKKVVLDLASSAILIIYIHVGKTTSRSHQRPE